MKDVYMYRAKLKALCNLSIRLKSKSKQGMVVMGLLPSAERNMFLQVGRLVGMAETAGQ
jgi:hypothetical protein